MTLENSRSLGDADLSVTANIGAVNTRSNSASIDLKQAYSASEGYAVQIDSPAMPNVGNTQVVTYTLEDSADDSTFVPIVGVGTYAVTANASGTQAGSQQFKLPPATRQYIRGFSNGNHATSTAAQWTLSLKF